MAERNYDFTEIKTRIIIRNDSAENWAGSEVILEKGEPAIEYDAVNKTAKIKFGDGTSTFSELPFSTLTPTEINSVIGNISSSVSGMQFKGTVGTSGTVTDISSIQSPQNGDTYKIITGITLTSEQSLDGNEHELTVGDIIICSSDKWVFVPSGNEDITSIKIAGSGDTINVSTTAQTGEVVLGTAAGINTATSVTNDTTTVPTTNAVKVYVDELENTLGTAAITDASDYATSAQGTLAENAMPKSGGTFTGDVIVNADLTADSIKTSGEITITPTTQVDITTNNQEHDNSKITFANNTGKQPISIEAKYKAIYFNGYPGHVADSSYLNINAEETHINGSVIIDSHLTVPGIDGILINHNDIDIHGDYGPKSCVSVHTGNGVDTSPTITFGTRVPNPGQQITSVELYSNQTEIHNGTNGRILLQNTDNSEITLNTGNNSNINLETGTNGNINLAGTVKLKSLTDTEIPNDSLPHDTTRLIFSNTHDTESTNEISITSKYRAYYGDNAYIGDHAYLSVDAEYIDLNGKVTLQGHPTENLHAATKKYVDDSVSSISTDSLIDGENILILNGGSATE